MAHFCGWNWFSPGLLPCLIHSPILLVRLLRAHTDWNIVIEMIKWLRHYPARRVTKLSFPPFSHTFRASKCTSLATPTLWLRPTRSTRFASDFGVRHRGPVGSIWHQYGINMHQCDDSSCDDQCDDQCRHRVIPRIAMMQLSWLQGLDLSMVTLAGEDPISLPSSRRSCVAA
jgi:hypothetical protein